MNTGNLAKRIAEDQRRELDKQEAQMAKQHEEEMSALVSGGESATRELYARNEDSPTWSTRCAAPLATRRTSSSTISVRAESSVWRLVRFS